MLNKIKDYLGIRFSKDFADYLGVKPTTLSNWHKRNTFDHEVLFTKCGFVDPEWLITGEGEMLKSENKKVDLPVAQKNNEGIPLIPTEAMAGWGGDNPPIQEGDILDRYIVPDFIDIDFMIRVKGNSMEPTYKSGDIVACRMVTNSRFMQWNRVFVVSTKDQGVIIKRVRQCKEEPECLQMISDNIDYDPFDVPKDEILNVALVVGSISLE